MAPLTYRNDFCEECRRSMGKTCKNIFEETIAIFENY